MGCLLFHKWKPHYRKHAPIQKEFEMLVVRSLFAGPPIMVPTGIMYTTTETKLYDKCVRCGKKRL